ncbi:hypothetical protein BDW62DRAFT_149482 [Aspergillus aurantiobrunneus]
MPFVHPAPSSLPRCCKLHFILKLRDQRFVQLGSRFWMVQSLVRPSSQFCFLCQSVTLIPIEQNQLYMSHRPWSQK